MSTYEWYLFGHLFGVFLLVGAAGLSTAAGIAAGRTKSPAVVVTLLDMQRWTERIVTSAGAIIVVVFGVLLVNEADFSMGDPWISATFALLIVVLGIDHGVLVRRGRQARDMAAAIPPGQPVTAELKARLNDPVTIAAGAVLDLSFLVFLYLMIGKPGA